MITDFGQKTRHGKLKGADSETFRGKPGGAYEGRIKAALVDDGEHVWDTAPIEKIGCDTVSGQNNEIAQADPVHRVDPVQASLEIFFRNDGE